MQSGQLFDQLHSEKFKMNEDVAWNASILAIPDIPEPNYMN